MVARNRDITSSPATGDESIPSESPRKRQKRSGATPTPRRRTACQSCRLRKVKCDAARPCALCKASGSKCEYLDNAAEKLTLESATSSIIERLDELQKSVSELEYSRSSAERPAPLDLRLVEPNQPPSENFNEILVTEPSRDFLQIPAHRTTADTVLNWPIFGDRYPKNALIGVLFQTSKDATHDADADTFSVAPGLHAPDDERIPQLVDNFLQNVHTKNPILDVESLVKQARRCAEHGLGWDANSCLLLLACALGSIAKPFDMAAAPPPSSAGVFAKELQQGESCFVLACRRLGALKHTMLGAQCEFYAGVYLMYTLRPLLSWQHFYHASVLYQLYLKTTHGVVGSASEPFEIPGQHLRAMSRKQRRLEQSLYWSCFKSESEFRVELPLPQSEIATLHHPDMFPSPPNPAGAEPESGQISPTPMQLQPAEAAGDVLHDRLTRFDTGSSSHEEDSELRQHAKKLCSEEESWYYYLTEIALRRIGNRIINTFFRQDPWSWLNIKPLLRIASEFDAQVSSWSANLPPAMQHYETNSTIRAPKLDSLNDSASNYVSRELSWAIDNRLLEMRSWLYQPFLYYLIHSGALLAPIPSNGSNGFGSERHAGGSSINSLLNPYPFRTGLDDQPGRQIPKADPSSLNSKETAVLRQMITSGIECNMKMLDVRSLRHRHHGLWYDLRSIMCASLVLLAVVKSGNEAWIPGGAQALWGSTPVVNDSRSNGPKSVNRLGGRLAKILEQFEFWSIESPDLRRHLDVLEEVARDVQSLWAGRNGI